MTGPKIWFAHRRRLINVRLENSQPYRKIGLMQYAREKGIKVIELTEKEKAAFIKLFDLFVD